MILLLPIAVILLAAVIDRLVFTARHTPGKHSGAQSGRPSPLSRPRGCHTRRPRGRHEILPDLEEAPHALAA